MNSATLISSYNHSDAAGHVHVAMPLAGAQVSTQSNGSMPELTPEEQMRLMISSALWWFVVVSCAVSLPFYGYAFRALWRQRRHWRHWQFIVLSIIVVDTIMLCIMFSSLLVAKYFHELGIGIILCKSMVYTTNVAAFFTNWCWVFIWGRRLLAIYQPLRRFRHSRSSRRKYMYMYMLVLLLIAIVVQVWGILFTTEYRDDDNGTIMVYCELDQKLVSYDTIKWVVLAESVGGYMVPFLLIVVADVLVLYRSYSAADLFTTITTDQLGSNSGSGMREYAGATGQLLAAKIVSERRMKERMKCKYRSIIGCVMAASLDMLLNLPDYSLQILDNFVSLKENPDYQRLFASLEAFAFVLYFLQYPMIAVYVRWLLKDFSSQSDRPSKRKEVSFTDNLPTNSLHSKTSTRKKSDSSPSSVSQSRDRKRGLSLSNECSISLLQVTSYPSKAH